MAFNTPSYEDLLEQNKANIRSKFPDASLLSRSFLTVYAKIIAMATYSLYKFGEWIFRQIFIDTADAENLERHAKNRGKPRKEASFAQGNIIFKGTNNVSIPADTELKRADGVFYKTTSSAVIADGQAVVPVKAVDAGQSGNLEADSVLSMTSAIVGIETTVNVAENRLFKIRHWVERTRTMSLGLKKFRASPVHGVIRMPWDWERSSFVSLWIIKQIRYCLMKTKFNPFKTISFLKYRQPLKKFTSWLQPQKSLILSSMI